MKKIVLWACLLIAALLLHLHQPVFAADAEDRSYASLELVHDEDIQIRTGDVFEFLYHAQGSDAYNIMEIDVKQLKGNHAVLDFDVGTYEIVAMRYIGLHEDVAAASCAVLKEFTVRETTSGYILIAVGPSSSQSLANNYPAVTWRDDFHQLWEGIEFRPVEVVEEEEETVYHVEDYTMPPTELADWNVVEQPTETAPAPITQAAE